MVNNHALCSLHTLHVYILCVMWRLQCVHCILQCVRCYCWVYIKCCPLMEGGGAYSRTLYNTTIVLIILTLSTLLCAIACIRIIPACHVRFSLPWENRPIATGGEYFLHAEHEQFAPRRFIHDRRLWENRPSIVWPWEIRYYDGNFLNRGDFLADGDHE